MMATVKSERNGNGEVQTFMEEDGRQVLDATDTITTELEDDDFTKATPCDPGACFGARALRRSGYYDARVTLSRAYTREYGSDVWHRRSIGPVFRRIIGLLDYGNIPLLLKAVHAMRKANGGKLLLVMKVPGKSEKLGTPRRGGVANGKGPKRTKAIHFNLRYNKLTTTRPPSGATSNRKSPSRKRPARTAAKQKTATRKRQARKSA
jgi:hypothetical protein